jgi:hypothetical protein
LINATCRVKKEYAPPYPIVTTNKREFVTMPNDKLTLFNLIKQAVETLYRTAHPLDSTTQIVSMTYWDTLKEKLGEVGNRTLEDLDIDTAEPVDSAAAVFHELYGGDSQEPLNVENFKDYMQAAVENFETVGFVKGMDGTIELASSDTSANTVTPQRDFAAAATATDKKPTTPT